MNRGSPRPEVPQELTNLLLEFTVSVLVHRPTNLVEYAANYFSRLHTEVGGSGLATISSAPPPAMAATSSSTTSSASAAATAATATAVAATVQEQMQQLALEEDQDQETNQTTPAVNAIEPDSDSIVSDQSQSKRLSERHHTRSLNLTFPVPAELPPRLSFTRRKSGE